MKKILSLMLVAVMAISVIPAAHAEPDRPGDGTIVWDNYDLQYQSASTDVTYVGAGREQYTIRVPAQMAPGDEGSVTLQGTWANNHKVTVTADATVTLTNNITAADKKTLNVNFDGISEKGSNTAEQTFTKGISIDPIEAALFGTWSGTFEYNVEMTDALISFELVGNGVFPSFYAEPGMTWGEWVESDYNTLKFEVQYDDTIYASVWGWITTGWPNGDKVLATDEIIAGHEYGSYTP